MGLVNTHVIIRKINGRSVFGKLKAISENVVLLQTDHIGKINLDEIVEIKSVPDYVLEKVKKDFGLRF